MLASTRCCVTLMTVFTFMSRPSTARRISALMAKRTSAASAKTFPLSREQEMLTLPLRCLYRIALTVCMLQAMERTTCSCATVILEKGMSTRRSLLKGSRPSGVRVQVMALRIATLPKTVRGSSVQSLSERTQISAVCWMCDSSKKTLRTRTLGVSVVALPLVETISCDTCVGSIDI